MSVFAKKWARFLLGALLVIVILGSTVIFLPGWIETYGATSEEVKAIYPGDEILPSPVIQWTHAITIKAPTEAVWPWIAQIGQSRGGYYSYTFIENRISGDASYQNASQILPQHQNPQPGQDIIKDMLPIKEVSTGKYFLAATQDFFGMGWTWLWYLKPLGTDETRLIIRMKIQTPGEPLNPAATWILDAGGFIMEKCMLRGIQERAEGRFFQTPIEPLEIFVWVGTLLVGLAAIWPVMKRRIWLYPLATGLLVVIALLVFTFIQPPIFLRIVIFLVLFLALGVSFKPDIDPAINKLKKSK